MKSMKREFAFKQKSCVFQNHGSLIGHEVIKVYMYRQIMLNKWLTNECTLDTWKVVDHFIM